MKIDSTKIFDRFHTSDESRSGNGNGLGLAIVILLSDKLTVAVSATVDEDLFTFLM